MAANCGIDSDRFYTLTFAELKREIKGFWFRHQLEQSNFREIVYTLACINSKKTPNKQALWPIPEIDKYIEDSNQSWVNEGRAALEYFKSIGKI